MPQIAGVPAFLGLLAWLRAILRGGPAAERTAGELPAWQLAGRLYGRYFQSDELRGTAIERREHRAPKSRREIDGIAISRSCTR